MKEFSTTLKEGLAKGLRPNNRSPRNSGVLVDCYNLKPNEDGLLPYETLANPFTGVTTSWPFPQVFLGQDIRVLATATKVYELSTWTLGTAKLTVASSGRWDFLDFGPYLILTNGTKLCVRSYAGTWSANDYLATVPRFSTGCVFNGQIVAGNIKSTWYDCGTGSLVWSRIGDIDCTPGGDNEAGFRNIPWEGTVLRVKKLGKGVVVYGQNGVGVLTPFHQTFGFDTLLDVGVSAMSAVGGNDSTHIFMDTDDNLWSIDKDFNVKELGYSEFMAPMDAEDVVVEYNPVLKEFHIGDGLCGFVLTEAGLAECCQSFTTIVASSGIAYGVFVDQESTVGRIITDTIDFGLRGIKTIQTVEVGASHSLGNLNVYVQWRTDKTAAFTNGPTRIVNPDGVATVTTSGDEFRIVLTFSDYTEAELDYITLRVKLTDKRYVRGIYNVTKNAS